MISFFSLKVSLCSKLKYQNLNSCWEEVGIGLFGLITPVIINQPNSLVNKQWD